MDFRRNISDSSVGFQMAPMVDIVFLLLIFFIAASVYTQWENKIGIKVPTAVSGKNERRFPGEVIINIDANGVVSMNNVDYSLERLRELLSRIAVTYPDQPAIIRADLKTDYESVIKVLDICKQVDIAHISFATLPFKNDQE